VTVRDGVVFLRTDTVGDDTRAALTAALGAIPGVTRVVLTAPPAPPAPVVTAVPATPAAPGLLTGLLPGGGLFKPLTADPRWPHFSLAYRYRLDDADLRNIFAPSLGETLALYRADLDGADSGKSGCWRSCTRSWISTLPRSTS
jgi:hypothetical protein